MTEQYHRITLHDNDDNPEFVFKTLATQPQYSITIDTDRIEQIHEQSYTRAARYTSFKKAQVSITESEARAIYETASQAFVYAGTYSRSVASPFKTESVPDVSKPDPYPQAAVIFRKVFTLHYSGNELEPYKEELIIKY